MDYVKPQHQMILAGMLAHSNMGFGIPKLEHDMLFRDYAQSADGLVSLFFQERVEDDDTYNACREECEAWMAEDRASAEKVQQYHQDHWARYINVLKSKRWEHAATAMNGASNQRLLSRCLQEAIVDVQDERGSLKDDAAVQFILNQLAQLLGQPHIMTLTDYSKYSDAITAQLAEYEQWSATVANPLSPPKKRPNQA